MTAPIDHVEGIAAQIVEVVTRRPDACDTLEGVAAFWVRADLKLLRRALARLVDRRLLRTVTIAGKTHYTAGPGLHPG